MLHGSGSAPGHFRELDYGYPEALDRLNDRREAVSIVRFRDVSICVMTIRFVYIPIGFRGRKHEDRNLSQMAMALDALKHFTSADLRQIPIQ